MSRFQYAIRILIVILVSAVPALCQQKTKTGFYYPVNKQLNSNLNWLACGSSYYANTRHLGSDIILGIDTPVYAVADGTVIVKSGPTQASGWGIDNYALGIQHSSNSGDFVALYGHIHTNLAKGSKVVAGQLIGTIGRYYEKDKNGKIKELTPHLHFGIFPGAGSSFPKTNLGRIQDAECANPGNTNGFVAPITWINTKTPTGGGGGTSSRPNLMVIKMNDTGTNSTEVHLLSGASIFKQFLLQTGTPQEQTWGNYAFATADWDQDGKSDLFVIKKNSTGSGSTEIHILSGASNFQKFILHAGTALQETWSDFDFAVGDWNRDGKPDLIAIKKYGTGTGSTEVHILSGASNFKQFLLHTGTAQGVTGDNYAFEVADWNGDGRLDLIVIKKNTTGTNSTEVHILSGAGNFQQFLLHTGTAQEQTWDNYAFAVCDWNRDGRPDLVVIKKSATGTRSTEVHILSGAGNFQQFILHTGTAQGETGNNYAFEMADR